jgi:hypothetical protein
MTRADAATNLGKRCAVAVTVFMLAFGCPAPFGQADLKSVTYDKVDRFASDREFDDYVDKVASIRRSFGAMFLGGFAGCASADTASKESPAPAESTASADGDSITNNQEGGVDEGDIVKAHGDFLVVLRRGRIFTVRVEEAGQPTLTPVARISTMPPGYTQGTWYDEMLLGNQRIVVIGYSYQVGATEIGLFRLGDDGSLAHQATYFMRSNDYYSSRNYASRLLGDQLVLYMPYTLFSYSYHGSGFRESSSLPAMRKWKSGDQVTEWRDVVPKTEVHRPVQPTSSPVLHTILQCDLSLDEPDCTGRAVTGPYARTFYVSREAVYIWVSSGYSSSWGNQQEEREPEPSCLYRLPLDGSDVTSLRAHGAPLDQFSFKEADGHVNVLLMKEGGGDGMFQAEFAGGSLSLLRVKLTDMTAEAPEVPATSYLPVPGASGYTMQNRFVGDHLLWGLGNGWYDQGVTEATLHVLRYASEVKAVDIRLPHAVDRIEVMGSAAVVVGGAGTDLHFSAVELGELPTLRGGFVQEDAGQGETRSHGFFFKPGQDGRGVLGLPVRVGGQDARHQLWSGSAEVLFLAVEPDLSFSPLGSLASREESQRDDSCEVSCADWYGNARPIFLRDRVMALMAYELVEGVLSGGVLTETARVDFLQR